MASPVRLISTDFDGTIVGRASGSILDVDCLEFIRELQKQGAAWAINTGRSVDFLEHGLIDLEFPYRPDFILTSERDVFRPGSSGTKWEPFGDWNARCASAHAELFRSAASILGEVMDFVNQKTKAWIIHEFEGPAGIKASSEEEMDRVT